MKVAIVGSRNYPDLEVVRRYVKRLPADAIVISGGARGVDTAAVATAIICGLWHHVFEPDQKLIQSAGFAAAAHARNRKIAEACEKVVAFSYSHSRGTASTVRFAKQLGRLVEVYEWPAVPEER